MQLNLPTMQVEQWDADKLRYLINHFGLTYKDISRALLDKSPSLINALLNQHRPFEKYNSLLTAYKNALIVARIKAAKAHCEEMINYYQSF